MKTNLIDPKQIIEMARAVITTEAQAVELLLSRIDDRFVEACRYMHDCQGRIVVIGMGKSGHIGGKIAATLASTGSPAFFVHPGEASHGDLGMITASDVVITISNSGETEEILNILPIIRRLNVPMIAMTGNAASKLAQLATIHLDVSVEKEACPLGLAPTSSTTVALVMGDALAIALLETRGFTPEDFARSHPGGRLGRRLLLHVSDIMHSGDAVPAVTSDTSLADALLEITRKGLGMTAVIDVDHHLLGVFTDGDLRRTLSTQHDLHQTPIGEVMTSPGTSVPPEMLAADVVTLMESKRIGALPVVDEQGRVIGALNMQDLLRAGVV